MATIRRCNSRDCENCDGCCCQSEDVEFITQDLNGGNTLICCNYRKAEKTLEQSSEN